MAIVERVSQEDLILFEILRNPVLFFEFINNIDRTEFDDEYELTWYQKQFMLDFNSYVSISCGRSVGKTAALSALLLWYLIFNVFPEDYIVYTVPNRVHLRPVWTNYLVRLLRGNSFLSHFVESSKGINAQSYVISTKVGSSLDCRIAGTSGTGVNVVGIHTPLVILDESAFYPFKTFLELQPTLKTFIRGYSLKVSGVPNGLREKNVNWHCQFENKDYSKHHVSAFDNPRFTEKDKQNAIETFGGEDSDDYVHNVLGLPGRPVFALFDRDLLEISEYPVFKLSIDGTEVGDNLAIITDKLAIFPSLPLKDAPCFFGVDLGYTEPTAIFILYLDKQNRIKFHGKIKLTKVNYFVQEKIIDVLDSKFNPQFIAIDRGGVGESVVSKLQNDLSLTHKNYKTRIFPVSFGSNIILGTNLDGKEIQMKTKPLAVTILQDYSNQHKIVYSSTDLETVSELERMTYVKTPNGDIIYKTLSERGGKIGEDHFTSALLCAILGYYINVDLHFYKKERKKLASPKLNMWSINYGK